MLKSRYLICLSVALSIHSEAFADFQLKEGKIIKRHTPSSSHLIKQADVIANGYPWTGFFNGVANAAKRINSGPHNYSISAGQASDSAVFGFNNKKDEIKFAALANNFFASTLPNIVRVRDNFGNTTGFNWIEGDITLNNQVGLWTFGGAKAWQLSGKSQADLEEVLIHEFGHSMALNHTSTMRDNMGGPGCGMYANSQSGTGYMGQSMSSQLQTLYGAWGGGYGDIAISAYNYIDFYTVNGQFPYANCGFADVNNAPPTPSISNYTVNKGYLRSGADRAWAVEVSQRDMIRMKFTVEATKLFTNVPATVYFSTNDFISTTDTVLSTWNLTSNSARAPYVWEIYVTVPYTVHRGFAAIGVILDPANTVTEWSKNNNIAYFPIYILD